MALAVVASGLYALAACVRYETADTVSNRRIAEVMSPDHAWDAIVNENTIEGILATVTLDYVVLVSTLTPGNRTTVMVVETGSHDYERASPQWVAPGQLQVVVHYLQDVTFFKPHVDNVTVFVHPVSATVFPADSSMMPGEMPVPILDAHSPNVR